jgi:hypothetical protein
MLPPLLVGVALMWRLKRGIRPQVVFVLLSMVFIGSSFTVRPRLAWSLPRGARHRISEASHDVVTTWLGLLDNSHAPWLLSYRERKGKCPRSLSGFPAFL